MSTHNICFYEDLTKIIFELQNVSSNIKYAPDFFCCKQRGSTIEEGLGEGTEGVRRRVSLIFKNRLHTNWYLIKLFSQNPVYI